jgi:hypothetical protein
VHTRRVATFLLGIWIGCSLFMSAVAIENNRSPNLVLNGPIEPAGKMVQALGVDQARLLLSHLAAEQTRLYFSLWEDVEIPLALVLAAFLFLATQRRILPLVLCGLMLALVLFEHFAISPELAYRGRATDFPPGSAAFGAQARVWALNQVYAGLETTKLVVGGVLASYLFFFRTRRYPRKEAELVGHVDRSHAGE